MITPPPTTPTRRTREQRLHPRQRLITEHPKSRHPARLDDHHPAIRETRPRPQLPSEVQLYLQDTLRRLAVKPGMTGLWQVSGRSDLSWVESVRLDLRYVENWSLPRTW